MTVRTCVIGHVCFALSQHCPGGSAHLRDRACLLRTIATLEGWVGQAGGHQLCAQVANIAPHMGAS